jgi:hypothetical protein
LPVVDIGAISVADVGVGAIVCDPCAVLLIHILALIVGCGAIAGCWPCPGGWSIAGAGPRVACNCGARTGPAARLIA